MKHHIPVDALGANGTRMQEAVTACVHCGFCLPSCPTYQELGEEMDSPRGRIYLMKGVLEGVLDEEQVQPHIDRCLGCMACETSCPSGVRYHELLLPYRARAQRNSPGSRTERLRRWMALRTMPYARRFRLAMHAARLARRFARFAPAPFRPMLELVPDALPARARLPARAAPLRTPRARVALLTGCVQQVLEPAINTATVDVLVRNGVEVFIPQKQGCCGALPWHTGDATAARRLARETLNTFHTEVDAIVVNAAGCGSAMKEYPLILAETEDEDSARQLAARVVDVSVFLDRLGMTTPPPLAAPLRVAYHDACHLCHAQNVRSEPRRLLQSILGVELTTVEDGERCCGSAGTYNLDQPDIAAALGRKKADAVLATRCEVVATGNIGCMVQLRTHLTALARAQAPPVLHTMQLLALAYQRKLHTIRGGARAS